MAQTTSKSQNNEETNHRLNIINSILHCPHRDLDQISAIHIEAQKSDPLFYAKFAAWHKENGEIRNHNEVFAGLLCTDAALDNRETGLALLRALPPYMKENVKGFIKGKTIKIRKKLNSKMKTKKGKEINKVEIELKTVGLKKNLPNSFKSEISAYLKWLEIDIERFDTAVLNDFSAIQGLYASCQIKPSDRAKKILFEGEIPEGSKLLVLKEILTEPSPAKKAELIIKNKVPYTTAVGLIKKITPSILTALISVMSPQEVMNNINSLKEKGAYDNEDIKKMVLDKLKKAETSRNVAGLKSKVAKKAADTDDVEINAQLDKIADVSIKKKGTIKMPTGIIVDRSKSMDKAIEIGKQVAAMVSGATESALYVAVADTMAQEIKAAGPTLTDWEIAFKSIKADGATSIGVGVDYFRRKKYFVEQLILITDEGENRAPFIGEALRAYQKEMNILPNVVVIRVKAEEGYNQQLWIETFRASLKEVCGDYSFYDIPEDEKGYYALPGLIPLLTAKSKLDLLYEIMDFELPQRKPFDQMFKSAKRGKKPDTKVA